MEFLLILGISELRWNGWR